MELLAENIYSELSKIIPADALSIEPSHLSAYSHDRSSHAPQQPLAVAWPRTAGEVAAILKWCNERRLPVTARGAGSSLEGNSIPTSGGLVLSLEKLDRIFEILPKDFQVTLQPGVVYDDLNKALAPFHLFFAPAPSSGSIATIGGMVGNNAGGLNALRYGVTRNHILRLEVALADGSLVSFGTRAMKTSSGFDLVQLMVGSEGMLGIVTAITLRLYGIPERRTVLVQFPSLDQAAGTVFAILASGIIPGALELIDSTSIHHINLYKGWDWIEVPTLLIEFHGTPAAIEQELLSVRDICSSQGALKFEAADSPSASEQLWAGRKEITNAEEALYPGYIILNGDIAVPLSHYADAVRYAREAGDRYGLPVTIFGHAGDGNIHCHTIVPPDDPLALENGTRLAAELIRFALSVGGTCTAEHGIGLAKKEFLLEEHGASVEVMKKIKLALDPNNILNPDKMFL